MRKILILMILLSLLFSLGCEKRKAKAVGTPGINTEAVQKNKNTRNTKELFKETEKYVDQIVEAKEKPPLKLIVKMVFAIHNNLSREVISLLKKENPLAQKIEETEKKIIQYASLYKKLDPVIKNLSEEDKQGFTALYGVASKSQLDGSLLGAMDQYKFQYKEKSEKLLEYLEICAQFYGYFRYDMFRGRYPELAKHIP